VRDVGRVMGLPYGQVDRIASLIPFNPAKPVTLAQAIEGEPKLQEMSRGDEQVSRLLEVAQELEGLYRNASTHAAGVVIGRRPLVDIVPLYRDPRSETLITQYSMKYVEQASLVKFDFLGLKTLTVLQRAAQLLAGQGIVVDLDRLPLDDAKTYAMLARGDAAGVFQFEGQGMRDCLRMMRPDRFEDLIAAVSLYRPGPMANIPAYCQRKHGEKWEAPHPKMAEIVGETYGILVYQEQVMQIAQELAGYSLGTADLLRRAMGKKIRSEMEAQRKIFVDGAVANAVPEAKAGEIFDLMEKFAEYGFNKSHAAPTRWSPTRPPTSRRTTRSPSWPRRCRSTSTRPRSWRPHAGMRAARHPGAAARREPLRRRSSCWTLSRTARSRSASPRRRQARRASPRCRNSSRPAMRAAPSASLSDFAGRVDPRLLNKMQLENLAKAGAFESLEGNRAKVVAGRRGRAARRAGSRGASRQPDAGHVRRRDRAAAAAPGGGAGLAGAREAVLRGGCGGLPPLGASAGYLQARAREARRRALLPHRGAGAGRLGTHEAGRHRGRGEVGPHQVGQQDGLGALLRRRGQLRGDLLQRNPGPRRRHAGGRHRPAGDHRGPPGR
jgi:DNA polymerase-3 subunit alpha